MDLDEALHDGDDDENIMNLLHEFSDFWAGGQPISGLRKEMMGDFDWDNLEKKGGFPWFSPFMCHCVRPIFLEEHEKLHGKGSKLSRTSVRALLMTLQLQQQSGSSAGPVALVDNTLLDQIFRAAHERFFDKNNGSDMSNLTFDQFFCTFVSDFMFGSPLQRSARSDTGLSPNNEELHIGEKKQQFSQETYNPLPESARVCIPTGHNALKQHEGELFKKSNSYLRSKRHVYLHVNQSGLFFFNSAKKKNIRHKVDLEDILSINLGSELNPKSDGDPGARSNSTSSKDPTASFSFVVVTKLRTFELCCPSGSVCMDWVSALSTHCLMNAVETRQDVKRVKIFIDQGANVDVSTVTKGIRPLILMAYLSKQMEIVKQFLKSGAEIRLDLIWH
jgi:hypothetical protein